MESLSRHLSPALTEARLARQYANIVERTARRRSWASLFAAPRLAIAFVACALVLVGVLVARPGSPTASPLDGTVAESRAGGELLTLADGTRMVLDARTRMRMTTVRADLVRIGLEEGGADFDVAHVDGRRFLIDAAGYEVSVIGTHFTVRIGSSRGDATLEVKVERGRVRVAREGHPESERALGAGEAWSTRIGEETAVPAPAPSAFVPEVEEPSESAPHASLPSAVEKPVRAVAPVAPVLPSESHPREAAIALDAIRMRFRGDSRAGLAAFELGRVRLDALKDPAGAVNAFDDALVLAPNAPFREDAEARRVQALEAMDEARCREAKASYLARYPQGVHRADVARRCGGL
jgi:transmembrane sensor